MRVARRDDDRCRHLGAVGERDASYARPFAGDRRHRALRAQGASCPFERGEKRARHHAAAADRTSDGADVAQRVGERAETAARRLGRDAPHHRADEESGALQRVDREVFAHHVGRAPAAPPQQRRHTAATLGEHLSCQPTQRRRIVCRVEHELHGRHRGGDVAAVALDLARVVPTDGLQGLLQRVEARPCGSSAPAHVDLRRVEVEVPQAQIGEAKLLCDGCRAERDVVAVADVHRGPGERLAGRGAADFVSRFDEQRAQPALRQVGRAHEAVVTGSDHDGVVVTHGHPTILAGDGARTANVRS